MVRASQASITRDGRPFGGGHLSTGISHQQTTVQSLHSLVQCTVLVYVRPRVGDGAGAILMSNENTSHILYFIRSWILEPKDQSS